ncbi:MAG TPA: carboxypeptidase-like regulatory domain-containing protein [Bryobacteraceae bacterium]|nr:carboxypeptidase-like regulatory domain-containing protein [Bryobacteraceae bacterium]
MPKFAIKFGLIAGMVGLTPALQAADADAIFGPSFPGQILGEVRNSTGVVQMGAVVSLYNRSDELLRRSFSNQDGRFIFDGLAPDVYSIRVNLASFVPALRRNISVLAGSENLLKIQLASALSTIELVPLNSPEGALMSDSWKWVLRSSHATRPVLRLLPQTSSSRSSMASLFSETTGLVKVSAGDGDPFSGLSQDLGTAFVLATSVNGTSKVRVSGNVGYAASGLPSAGFRTTYRREDQSGEGPQLAMTVRQIYLPSLVGSGGLASGTPALRTASLSTYDKMEILDLIHLEYGASLESISLLGRINHVNSFARATYDLGEKSAIKVAVSSGSQPVELLADGTQQDLSQSLNGDLAALGQVQRISRRDNQAAVERNKVIEAGYQTVKGSRTYRASVYAEDVSDAAFLLSGDSGFVDSGNLLPDMSSLGTIFDAGDYRRVGYSASVTQALGERVKVSVAAGHTDGLQLQNSPDAPPANGDELRSGIRNTPRPWVTAEVDGSLPLTGTYLATSYGWTDPNVLMPIHVSLTGRSYQTVGWNVYARQPLPAIGGMHMEVTADLRNLLAQGYVGIQSGTRRTVLTNAPRAVRGGVSFIF